MVEQRLREWAARNGYRTATGPASVLEEVRAEIRQRGARGDLDPGFAGKWLGWIGGPEDGAGRLSAESVIGVAVPCPLTLVHFALPDRVLAAVIPPTYCEDARLGDQVREELLALLPELEGSLVQAAQGRKAVAARLGLTAYGMNNITYSRGLGSLVWIGTYATAARIPASAGGLQPTESMLPDCESCGRCRDACPTGAIAEERFLLRAERCLTCWNELPDPLPSWIPEKAHNCLVGCMVCQEVCPQNEGLLSAKDSGIVFDEQETRELLSGGCTPESAVSTSVLGKLTRLGLAGYSPVIGRNLGLLAGRRY
jgi:epoxyqueuosine reductase